eukprot:GHVP01022521.1.p1 GENE.GHVP01022521.1~~GHVP01022521.1.p1  ORF type:complete len:144 (+),score=27.32 GHVP01022521.1:30-434(+)
MKKKQILLEGSLTAASGLAGVSILQDNSCGSPTAHWPSAFHQDAALTDSRIATHHTPEAVKSYVCDKLKLEKDSFSIIEFAEVKEWLLPLVKRFLEDPHVSTRDSAADTKLIPSMSTATFRNIFVRCFTRNEKF